jgi:hypothetical protein
MGDALDIETLFSVMRNARQLPVALQYSQCASAQMNQKCSLLGEDLAWNIAYLGFSPNPTELKSRVGLVLLQTSLIRDICEFNL